MVEGPDFERPPVEEVALSVQFAPLRGLTTAHVARYWELIRERFPAWKEAPPIDTTVELFGAPRVGIPKFGFSIEGGSVPNRALFEDTAGSELVQVQRERFVRNWRRRDGSDEYPRYPALRQRFKDDLNQFSAFLSDHGLSSPDANQCEITYVNHLPAGDGWTRHGEVGKVVGPLSGRTSDDFLPEPETVEATLRYVFRWPGSEDPAGRLHAQIGSVHRVADGQSLLKVVLTARGRPRGTSTDDVLGWMDVGHDFLVRGFTSLTTENMHKVWGRRDVR